MISLLAFLLLMPAFAAHPISVKLTVYSTIQETDFGKQKFEPVTWRFKEGGPLHTNLFVRGFASRTLPNPRDPNLSGVAMEGNGFIEPSLHQHDPEMMALIAEGYRVLTLDEWDEKRQHATFILSKAPLSSSGDELINRVSAAVIDHHPDFPIGRWVRIDSNQASLHEYRLINDECSSCERNHIDLYYGPGVQAPNVEEVDDATATLMPPGFKP